MSANKRPLSPHLQVYRPQLTSMLSILHRATGVVLALGLLPFIYWLAALASGPGSYDTAQSVMGSIIGRLFLFGWTLCFFYHLSNGIRHLFWDAGYGFDMGVLEKSGWLTVIAAVVLSLGTWVLAYAMRG
jgi:succinate dehydrogenase / fumarate reductase cytochrome b subunit